MNFKLGREVCNNYELANSREWLVTNGIGGYATGTVSGALTRRYQGLLIAALNPPVARTLLLTKLDETVTYGGQAYELSTNNWLAGVVEPQGYLNVESFNLAGTSPVWTFAFADGLLTKQIWMQQGENTTYIRYSYIGGNKPLALSLKALVNDRDYHGNTHIHDHQSAHSLKSLAFPLRPSAQEEATREELEGGSIHGLTVKTFADSPNLYLSAIADKATSNFHWSIENIWYRNFCLKLENYRGLDATEDHLCVAIGSFVLQPQESITIVASTEDRWSAPEFRKCWGKSNYPQLSNQTREKREQELVNLFVSENKLNHIPNEIKQLVLAADQFVVDRPLSDHPHGKTIIAGYPWFTDWGRDTMIALPGLAIATGRYQVAKTILLTFAKHIDQGMLPNLFPDLGSIPEYNTVDATLWYFEAVRSYWQVTKDREFLAELFPLLTEIIDWHLKGTRYNIHVEDDGLLYAGGWGIQLTWMDAKVDDWVVTPRIGKPIEVNALWYNALICMVEFAQVIGKSTTQYQQLATKTRANFSRFWYEQGGYCYDVIDSPNGNDASFRPNQIFAVSLPKNNLREDHSLLTSEQQKIVVAKVGENLVTPYGLRSLAIDHPCYIGIYGGNQLQRDGSYHQGTTWGWLIGHYLQAHLQVYKNAQLAHSFLEPMFAHLEDGCVGNVSEIFDGDSPFTPRGCFAQAWSVAEVIRSWLLIQQTKSQ